VGIASGGVSRNISLLAVERLRNIFLEFNVLISFVVPKYLVVSFPKDCLGLEKFTNEYFKNGCNILTFGDIDSTNFRGLGDNQEILFWLVDSPDKLAVVHSSWVQIVKSNPTTPSYLTVLRAQRKVS
jgi:hypothetical protein